MYPFPDYYAQFGIVLKTTPYTTAVALHYNRTVEIIFIIVFLLILSTEIFSSLIEILHECIKENRRNSTLDLTETRYEQITDTPTLSLSQTEQIINESISSALDTTTNEVKVSS